MKILTLENNPYSLNHLPDQVEETIRFAVLDNSNPADPDFFFSRLHHKEAFSHLIYGIHQRKGILVVTGEIGTGKTTLCRTLLHHLDGETKGEEKEERKH